MVSDELAILLCLMGDIAFNFRRDFWRDQRQFFKCFDPSFWQALDFGTFFVFFLRSETHLV